MALRCGFVSSASSAISTLAIEAVEKFAHIGDGNGSYWADHGYSRYAGI
jgi:hypothetical protein